MKTHTPAISFCRWLTLAVFGLASITVATQAAAPPGTLVDHFGNVPFRPSNSFGERTREEVGAMVPTAFAFVPGHYYTSNYFSLIITEYDPSGTVVGSYTVPSALGEEVRGLAFGADGLLYATLSRGASGFAVLALESDGNVAASYVGSVYIAGDAGYGKIAMDNQYLYVCGQDVLTRFLLGDPSAGTTFYAGSSIIDVKPLPNGNLFVASQSYVDEITASGAFVRRIHLTGGQSFTDIRGIEYNPWTNILFVTHLGHSGFEFRIMRIDATTGALLNSAVFTYAEDMFLDLSGNLLVGSSVENPTFFSQDLVQGNSLNGGQQMFVTQYAPLTGTPTPIPTPTPHTPTPSPTPTPTPTATATATSTATATATATATPTAQTKLLNISTRLRVLTEDNALIGGFIVTGSAPKRVIVRAIGPSLTTAGVPGALADPVLELHGPGGFSTVTNDNWRDTQESEIEATGLAPSDNLESAIVAILPPGAYTAVVRGNNGGTGVGLIEAYDLDSSVDAKLANISTRGFVETGDNVMIGGFILGPGSANERVLIRAIGPSLTNSGVPDALGDPLLELHNSNGDIIGANDNWRDTQQAEIEATGIPPNDDRESAIVQALVPGAYTAIVRGKNSTTGVALVEAYQLARAATPTPTPTPSPTPSPVSANFGSLSSRFRVGTGDSIVLNAFIISGPVPKRVIVRGIGPSLAKFGVPDPLADPVLELHGSGGFVTITNDNWRDTQEAEIIATGLAPTDDLESAIVATLTPGSYTVLLRGKNSATGVGLNDVYDLSPSASSSLSAVGTRANIITVDNARVSEIVMPQTSNVVIRALGPSLTNVGIPNALADPTLELRDGNGSLIRSNNDWQDDPVQAAMVTAAGLAPSDPHESAIAATLPPGSYIGLEAGLNSGAGIGYLQFYALPHSGPVLPLTISPTPAATPTPSPSVAKFIELSSRAMVRTGDAVALNAFIISGSVPKQVLVRGIGPSLAGAGVPDPLPDPVLELHGPAGFTTIINDNWRDTQAAAIKATGLAPTDDLEAAILVTLTPASYAVILRGNNNVTGTGLNELYDLSQSAPSNLTAVGTRANILNGADILISGIIMSQAGGVVIRGLGPSLAQVGIAGVLANPTIELRDDNGTLIRVNNDWQDDPAQAAIIAASGLAPSNPLESGIAVTLPSGSYTGLALGLSSGTGIGYLQFYTLPHSGPVLQLTP